MKNCLFCKIVAGKIPSYTIYEDDDFLGFLDIFPRVKGHALLIPKIHYRWVYDVPQFGEYWEVAKQIGLAEKKVFKSRFVSFVTMGEAVQHAHIHILPQCTDSVTGLAFQPTVEISKKEFVAYSHEIKSEILNSHL